MGSAFGSKSATARTAKRCFWCGEIIERGDKYRSWCWVDGGDFNKIVCHAECAEAWSELDFPDNEEVWFGEQCRGCTCERGRCECGKGGEQ